jgi:hypothetical protein
MPFKLSPYRARQELTEDELGAVAEAFGPLNSAYPEFDELAFSMVYDLLRYLDRLNRLFHFPKGELRLLRCKIKLFEFTIYTVEVDDTVSYEGMRGELAKLYTAVTLTATSYVRQMIGVMNTHELARLEASEQEFESKLLELEALTLIAELSISNEFGEAAPGALRKSKLLPNVRTNSFNYISFPVDLQCGTGDTCPVRLGKAYTRERALATALHMLKRARR